MRDTKDMKKKMKYILTLAVVLGLFPGTLNAQDLHYARVQDLGLWYNPSLKQERSGDIRMNYRDVRYQDMLAYRSTAVLGNVPLGGRGPEENAGFWNLSIGAAVDQSNQNILKNTQGVLGLSYAVPLTGNGQYLSVSIQGSFLNSRLDLGNAVFPDQFDRNGPISGAMTRDPLGVGSPRNWFSSHLGVAMFQSSEGERWSLGVSLRDVTRPLIQRNSGLAYRLQPTLGLQGGYETQRGDVRYSFYGVANLKAEAFEQVLSAGISYLPQSAGVKGIGGGIAYRVRGAAIPYAEVSVGGSTVGVYYELDLSGIRAAGYRRNAFELSLKQQLFKKKTTDTEK